MTVTGQADTGGIAGLDMDGSIYGTTAYGMVKGSSNVGGIVGSNLSGGVIEIYDCRNLASVQASIAYAGGIIGYHVNNGDSTNGRTNTVILRSCNNGDITAPNTLGGIVGYSNGNLTIMYAYNTGSVYANVAGIAGGIVGRFNEPGNHNISGMSNCYNVGSVSGMALMVGSIVGYNNAALISFTYYLDTISRGIGSGNMTSGVISLNSEQMKSLNNTIAAPFILDYKEINDGYPVLDGILYKKGDEGTFTYSEGENKTGVYYYDDNYFSQSSYNYNESLATMSICLALASYGTQGHDNYSDYSKNGEALLVDIGFTGVMANDMYNMKPTTDSIGAVIGHKVLESNDEETDSEPYTLIALGIRGGGYEAEWASNFTMGYEIEGQHKGFSEAKDNLIQFMREYIESQNITGNIKLWISGFSRAGGTANLIAGAIDNGLSLGNVSLDLSGMYTYCFEPPMGGLGSYTRNEKEEPWSVYRNIFNIVNMNDLVPAVAPKAMGFSRYGIDKPLPSPTQNSDYLTLRLSMLNRLYTLDGVTPESFGYVIDSFQTKTIIPDSILGIGSMPMEDLFVDLENTDLLQSAFIEEFIDFISNDLFKSRDLYAEYYENDIREVFRIMNTNVDWGWDGFLSEFLINLFWDYASFPISSSLLDSAYDAAIKTLVDQGITEYDEEEVRLFVMKLIPLITKILTENINGMATLIRNIDGISQAHSPELCLAWLQSMDPNYTRGASVGFSKGAYRTVRINCPVDAEVYDATNNLVAAIYNNVPQKIVGSSIASTVNADSEKLFYLPADADYSVRLTATGDGTMNYSINERSYALNDVTRIVDFNEILLQAGDTFTGDVPAFDVTSLREGAINGSDAVYTLANANDLPITPDIDLTGDDAIEAKYYVEIVTDPENAGYVTGQGTRRLGNFAQVQAVPYSGYTFIGWYDGDIPVSEDAQYRFRVEEDITLTAKFQQDSSTITPPIPSLQAGTYTSPQSVELTVENGAAIYYTIDGSIPTADSTQYSAAISITTTTTLKAIAVKDSVSSDVMTAVYTIAPQPAADKSALEVLLRLAETYEPKLDLYLDIGKAEFIDALSAAREQMNDPYMTQLQVDAAYDRLFSALVSLRLKPPVNRLILNSLGLSDTQQLLGKTIQLAQTVVLAETERQSISIALNYAQSIYKNNPSEYQIYLAYNNLMEMLRRLIE